MKNMMLRNANKLLEQVRVAPRHVREAIYYELLEARGRELPPPVTVLVADADEEPSPARFYTTRELAAVINMSVKYVIEHRNKIAGAHREGRFWRFDKAIIDGRIASGKSIII